MIEIASSLNYFDFYYVENCTTTKEMWEKFALFHGGDDNVLRAKVETLRGKYDDMQMKEGDNVE